MEKILLDSTLSDDVFILPTILWVVWTISRYYVFTVCFSFVVCRTLSKTSYEKMSDITFPLFLEEFITELNVNCRLLVLQESHCDSLMHTVARGWCHILHLLTTQRTTNTLMNKAFTVKTFSAKTISLWLMNWSVSTRVIQLWLAFYRRGKELRLKQESTMLCNGS